MAKRQFKAESKRLLDLMINSIYTNKEIFLREIVSNASDAIDKLYYKGLKEGISGLTRSDFQIEIKANKENNTLTISVRDKGVGIADIRQAMQPMYTTDTKTERAGLGFAVMLTFMDKVKVYSAPGKGTRVVMTKNIG